MIDDYYGHVIATVEGTAEESSVVWQRLRIGATTENTERHRGGMGGELGAGDGLAGQAAGHHWVLLDGRCVWVADSASGLFNPQRKV